MAVTGNKALGAVVYTRVSTGEQAEHGTSLDGQRDACRAKALTLGLPIVAEYEDAGVSGGFLLTRAGMQAALATLARGEADTLICANLSRYSRDVEHQQAIKKAVRAAGGRLVFCDMTFEETPEGDLAFGIMGNFAEYEKAVIRKRTMSGREARAREGIQTARAYSPFGYHIVSTADVMAGRYPAEERGKYLVVEEQAAVVRDLFDRYAAGESLVTLARQLNESGLPTRIRASVWRINTLRYILGNPVYRGVGAFGKRDHAHDETRIGAPNPITGTPMRTSRVSKEADPETWITWAVPALVTEEVWNAVQARFKTNVSKLGGNPRRVRMLAGRIFCPHCGTGLNLLSTPRRIDRHRASYVCGKYRQDRENLGTSGCEPTYYAVADVEAAVVAAITDAAQRPDAVQQVITAALNAYNAPREGVPAPDAGAAIDAEMKALAAQEAATIKAQIAGIMAGAEPAAYATVFADLAARRKALEQKRKSIADAQRERGPASGLTPADGRWTAADFPRILADTRRVLTSPNMEDTEKRAALGHLVEAVYPIKCTAPYERDGSDGARVVFQPGVFPPPPQMTETFQLLGKKCCLNFVTA